MPSLHGTKRTPLAVQAWGESTLKGNTLYLHVFDWPRDGRLVVGGLKSAVRKAAYPVKRIGPLDVELTVPAVAPDPADSVIALELAGSVETDPVRLLSTHQRNSLRAFDARLEGGGFHYTDGKAPHAYVFGWTKIGQSIVWPARLKDAGEFEVRIVYSTGSPKDGGRFAIEAGGQKLEAAVQATAKDTEPRTVSLGVVKLATGAADIRIRALELQGEGIRPFRVELERK